MGTLSFSLIRFTQHNDCSEGFEDKQGGNVGPVPSEASVSPPPIAPSGAIPSKTIPTSQLPGKYKKRPFAYTEDSTDEEDVDMEIEDNDSSGSSVDSDHVPAKRLRTSIATRSSRAISVSEKSTDVGALPSNARDDTPGPGNSDTEPEPNCDPEVPDLNSSMNALSPGARLDPARDTTPPDMDALSPGVHSDPARDTTAPATPTSCSSEQGDMEVDEPDTTPEDRNTVAVNIPCTCDLANTSPVALSQHLFSGPAPGPGLKVPDFLTVKHNIYGYLSSVSEPGFKALLENYITFELADHSGIRGTLSTSYRPKAIAWWFGRARPAKLPPYDSLKSFTSGVMEWWIFVQPRWRKIKPKMVSRVAGDWEHLYQPGVNGLLNIVILAYWWVRILEERGTPIDETYTWFVSDVTWVLSRLAGVACDGIFNR